MILLVVGLVAVIVVVLIAVFLSIRLGRSDEHDEPGLESSGRSEHWRDRDTRRVSSSGSRGGRGEHPGYSSRGPARDRPPRGRDYDSTPRRPAREAPDYRKQPAARSAVGASAQARGRYDTGPSRRPAADDFPSADYPSMDFGPADGHAAGDHPSVEFAAVGYEAVDASRDRRDSRRNAAPVPANGKSRSRQRGKRDDDDDWPSSEWDKLSDEQYWAELSADKPLSTTARPSRPASDAAALPPASGSAKAKPAPRDARPPRPQASDRDLQRDLPGRNDRADLREPVTERLPVRAARQAPSPLPPARREADAPAAGPGYPEPRSALDPGHGSSHDTGPYSSWDTGPQPRLEHRRRDTTGPLPTRDRDLALLAGLASAPPPIPGALDDDPLTSPSFSLKAVPANDSRSYSNARKHAKTTPAADHSAANGAAHPNGNGHGGNGHSSSSSYPAADYADPSYAYQAAPLAAPAASDWYSAPTSPSAEAQAPAYGNPYAHTGSSNGGASAAYTDSQAAAGYHNYLADPLRVYSPSGYEAPAPYAEPASPGTYMAVPLPPAGSAPHTDSYLAQPYPDQAGYQDGYTAADGYAPGYEAGYSGDPYASGGYGPYPPQG